MPRFPSILVLCTSFLALVACGGTAESGEVGAPSVFVSYELGSTAVRMTHGLDEAGGGPHGEVLTSLPRTVLFASSASCSRAGRPPAMGLTIIIEGTGTGTHSGHLFQHDYEDGSGTTSEAITVQVTQLDAGLGLVKGTFSGATAKNGEFVVNRRDEVGYFAP
jgi:hypothetical protein